jgi:hypothetical protein
MATKQEQLDHARRKWYAELSYFNSMFGRYWEMEQALKQQRERISKAYKRYKELGGK